MTITVGIELSEGEYNKRVEWCAKSLGPCGWTYGDIFYKKDRWFVRSNHYWRQFYFAYDEDATMFRLAWL